MTFQTLLKVFAFCASLLSGAPGQVVLVLPEDPSCRATPEMVHDGLITVTDPNCLVANDEPGCNHFGLPDCRVCALIPESVADDILPCELLNIFDKENGAVGEESVDSEDSNCEPRIPPPVVPAKPVDPIQPAKPADPAESSDEEDYVPIVIVLPTDVFIEPESSVWDDNEGSTEHAEDSDAGDDKNATIAVPRHLRTQL